MDKNKREWIVPGTNIKKTAGNNDKSSQPWASIFGFIFALILLYVLFNPLLSQDCDCENKINALKFEVEDLRGEVDYWKSVADSRLGRIK